MDYIKIFIAFFSFCFFATHSSAQLMSGSLLDEGRKMITSTDFKFKDVNSGVLIYELAVNRTGKVTSAKVIESGSTIGSTPTRVKVRNYLMGFTFQEGTYYPEFHHVRVKITVVPQ